MSIYFLGLIYDGSEDRLDDGSGWKFQVTLDEYEEFETPLTDLIEDGFISEWTTRPPVEGERLLFSMEDGENIYFEYDRYRNEIIKNAPAHCKSIKERLEWSERATKKTAEIAKDLLEGAVLYKDITVTLFDQDGNAIDEDSHESDTVDDVNLMSDIVNRLCDDLLTRNIYDDEDLEDT